LFPPDDDTVVRLGASDYAADRIAALLEMNDIYGANVWRRIRAALLD